MIKAYLAQYEVYLWAAAAMGLLIALITFAHHERGVQHTKDLAADAKIVALQNQLKVKTEADAQKILNPANSQLRAALDAPPPIGAVTLRVCAPSRASGTKPVVSANGTGQPGSGGGPQPVPTAVAGLSGDSGDNIGPTTQQLLAKADAEIAYWRKYYADCVAHKICKAAVPNAN